MKVPCRWLAEYVELDINEAAIEHLAERLTLSGLEVEAISWVGPVERGVVGRVREHRPHPDSDHLSICRVDVGEDDTVEVVCGASNVVEDGLVPFVSAGSRLPNGLKIEARKIRGVASNGMICSKAELGLEERSSGIWNFDPALALEPGADLNDLLEFDDAIFDIKVTSNRPDCMGIYGIAREVAAITGRPLQPFDTKVRETTPAAASFMSIEVADPGDTLRYAARLMSQVVIGPAPLWMQHRLTKAGMRPLSNVVDVTNYVMLELGHPLHPFDADLIKEKIVVRRACAGESFRTLDGVDRRLSPEVLMITDRDGGLAIAGVMGGERSEIRQETTRVLLEVAAFDPVAIRHSVRAMGIRSEAAQRFERGVDPEGVPLAAARAAHLLQKLAGCRVHRGLVDAYPRVREPVLIRLRPSRVAVLLGVTLDVAEIGELLKRLEIETTEDGGDLVATVPTFRPDLVREVDLIEEVGRLYGYDRLPALPPTVPLRIGRKDAVEVYKERMRTILSGLGLSEVITDGFDKSEWREAFGVAVDELVAVSNPMTVGQEALRFSLLPGILTAVETNLNRRVEGGMLYELGRVFTKAGGERESLAAVLFGRSTIPLVGKREVDLGEAKGILGDLFTGLRLGQPHIGGDALPSFLHPHRGGSVFLDEEKVGFLGELAPDLCERFSGTPKLIAFELDLEALRERSGTPHSFSPPSRYPASKRDLSLIAPIDLPEAAIRKVFTSEAAIEQVLLYDLYQGEQVPAGRKSLTYEVLFRLADRTLTDEDVEEILARAEKRLADLDVHLRD
jgi:phenylalanyl-tRNA synthetase beta chain